MRDFIKLIEALTRNDAVNIFKKYGVDPTKMGTDELKSQYRGLVKKYHSDTTRNGNDEDLKNINAAYDVLKKPSPSAQYEPQQPTRPKPPEYEWWAQAGNSGQRNSSRINKNDFTDLNFIKKTIGEKAGPRSPVYSVMGFDGHFFRNSFSVYGNPSLFKLMAEAMIMWQTKGANPYDCRAVFVQTDNNPQQILLIWSDGIFHNPPIPFEHDSFNSNPSNDQSFVRNLPKHLDEIKNESKNEEPEEWYKISFRADARPDTFLALAKKCFDKLGKGFIDQGALVHREKIYNALLNSGYFVGKLTDEKWAVSLSEDTRKVEFFFVKKEYSSVI